MKEWIPFSYEEKWVCDVNARDENLSWSSCGILLETPSHNIIFKRLDWLEKRVRAHHKKRKFFRFMYFQFKDDCQLSERLQDLSIQVDEIDTQTIFPRYAVSFPAIRSSLWPKTKVWLVSNVDTIETPKPTEMQWGVVRVPTNRPIWLNTVCNYPGILGFDLEIIPERDRRKQIHRLCLCAAFCMWNERSKFVNSWHTSWVDGLSTFSCRGVVRILGEAEFEETPVPSTKPVTSPIPAPHRPVVQPPKPPTAQDRAEAEEFVRLHCWPRLTPIGDEDLDGKRHDAPEWNVDGHLKLKDIVSAKEEIRSSQEFESEHDSQGEMEDIVEWEDSSSAEETEMDVAERERITLHHTSD